MYCDVCSKKLPRKFYFIDLINGKGESVRFYACSPGCRSILKETVENTLRQFGEEVKPVDSSLN